LKPFIESRLVAVRANGLQTALGHFRSVRAKFVIRKCVRLNVNLAVREYPIAVLAVQSPLRLRHPVTFCQGAGLTVTNNAKTKQVKNVQN
jgi:hypothetical protein